MRYTLAGTTNPVNVRAQPDPNKANDFIVDTYECTSYIIGQHTDANTLVITMLAKLTTEAGVHELHE
jgi:hypothetical protein